MKAIYYIYSINQFPVLGSSSDRQRYIDRYLETLRQRVSKREMLTMRDITLPQRLVCPVCQDILNVPVVTCSAKNCPNPLMCMNCCRSSHDTKYNYCVTCPASNKSRRRLIGVRRIRRPCDPFIECKCSEPYNKACKIWKEINEDKKYKDAIDFLNEDSDKHCHNVTIDNSVSIDVIRDAKQMKGGEWVTLIQDQSANSEKHREAEIKTKAFLENEYKRELKREEERKKQELESEKLARELAKQFENESSGESEQNETLVRVLSQQGSDEEETKEVIAFDLQAWLKDNPDILRENEEAERRRKQLEKDEELARKLKEIESEPQLRSSQSTPPSSNSERKRKRLSFVSSSQKKKKTKRRKKDLKKKEGSPFRFNRTHNH